MKSQKRAGLVLVILVIVAAIPLAVASAAPPSPFSGPWKAVDNIDGSNLRLIISGGGSGTYHLRWTDDYWSICDGGPGRGEGTGTVSGDVLSVELTFTCGGSFAGTFTGDFTLNGDGTMTDTIQGATWSRLGH